MFTVDCPTLLDPTLLGVLPFRRGGDLLLKLINPDAAKPAVDLEQAQVVEALMALMLGDQVRWGVALSVLLLCCCHYVT